ncbi:hypothetical protein CMO91_00330 [Candidatus Woesearchaeota archaeon]|nr:hypothetical protein [Candidatus Woesearchaeota archaeon]
MDQPEVYGRIIVHKEASPRVYELFSQVLDKMNNNAKPLPCLKDQGWDQVPFSYWYQGCSVMVGGPGEDSAFVRLAFSSQSCQEAVDDAVNAYIDLMEMTRSNFTFKQAKPPQSVLPSQKGRASPMTRE